MLRFRNWFWCLCRYAGIGLVILIAAGSLAWLTAATIRPQPPSLASPSEKKVADPGSKLRRIEPNAVFVPPEVQTSLGLKTVAATAPNRKRKLPLFQGTLNFDSNRLARVQSPFTGPIIELGKISEAIPTALPGGSSETRTRRDIRVGDHVQKGDILAVVWSKDLGEKKSEFIDAISKLRTDAETYRRLDTSYGIGVIPERAVRDAERTVKADRVAVERAEATLRAWRIPPEDIATLQVEAERLGAADATRTDPAKWARVEIKAPLSGIILEKNVVREQVVDPTADLFRVGDLSTLAVWIHVYEEDVSELQKIPTPSPWVISLPARASSAYSGQLELVGASIDPTQHTALVTGTVDNKGGELRAGMFVTVTIELPPTKGEVEIPAEAVVEDGRVSFVFVRQASDETKFTRQPVRVLRRGRDLISVAAEPSGVQPGDHVVTAGSLLLNEAIDDLPRSTQ